MPKPKKQEVVTLKIPQGVPAKFRSLKALNRVFEEHHGATLQDAFDLWVLDTVLDDLRKSREIIELGL